MGSSPRRIFAAGAAVLAVTALAASPAQADSEEVQLSASATTVHPGDTFTVTETIVNTNAFTVLQPKAALFGTLGFTTMVGCTGVLCSTVDGPDGPIGYQGSLPVALSAGESGTVTFTLKVKADAGDQQHQLSGQLRGGNYASEPTNGPTITVDARADRAVQLTGTPRPGLLGGRIDFTVRVTNNGPDPAPSTTVTTSLPAGLKATSGCVSTPGTATCTLTGIANGADRTATFSVPYGLLTIGLPFTFTANRTGATPEDLNAANDTSSVTCTVITPLLVNCG